MPTPKPPKTARKRRPGRPKGSKTSPPPVDQAEAGRCHYCETNTLLTRQTKTRHFEGVFKGRAFNVVRWRWSVCKTCRRATVVKTHEMYGEKNKPAENF